MDQWLKTHLDLLRRIWDLNIEQWNIFFYKNINNNAAPSSFRQFFLKSPFLVDTCFIQNSTKDISPLPE